MDAFDFKPEPEEEEPQRNVRDLIFKLGTYYFLAGALCLIGYFIMVYLNPTTPLNPLPPAQPVSQQGTATTAAQPTGTSTPTQPAGTDMPEDGQATPTSTETVIPAADTATPTATLEPYPTATAVVLNTTEPAATAEASAFFKAQDGTPSYLPHANGCGGVYVAGYVIDADNNPLVHMTVRVVGVMGEQRINKETLSGSNTNYTESGWEIKLLDTPLNTSGQFNVALYKQGSPDPVSEIVSFDTFNSCTQNLVVVNFVQEN